MVQNDIELLSRSSQDAVLHLAENVFDSFQGLLFVLLGTSVIRIDVKISRLTSRLALVVVYEVVPLGRTEDSQDLLLPNLERGHLERGHLGD